jgi:hypothetical protein
MGWDSGRYYTRTKHVRGRFIREYVGGGVLGELAAAEDARRRAERKAQAKARRQEQERLLGAAALLIELCHLTDLLLKAALVNAGFYQHHRCEWRRRAKDTA